MEQSADSKCIVFGLKGSGVALGPIKSYHFIQFSASFVIEHSENYCAFIQLCLF